MVQMRAHDAQLQRFVGLSEVGVALCQDEPRRGCTGLDANHFLHDAHRFGDVGVDVGLVSLPDESPHLV